VDDFMATGKDESKLRSMFKFLTTKINIGAALGLVSKYNGIDIVKYRDCINVKRSWPIMDGNKAQNMSLTSLNHYIPAPSNNWRRILPQIEMAKDIRCIT
jgi:hypothetical protein